jgi:hypothetical protein
MTRVFVIPVLLLLVGCGGGSPTAPGAITSGGSSTSVQGVWTGTWQRQSCSETGGAVGVACPSLPSSGGLRLTLTQTGTSVTGTVEIGSVLVNATGAITQGTLVLNGSGRFEDNTITISNWSTAVSGLTAGTMTGTFSFTLAPDDTTAGTVTIKASLQDVLKG